MLLDLWALILLGAMNRPKHLSSKNDSDLEGKSLKFLP